MSVPQIIFALVLAVGAIAAMLGHGKRLPERRRNGFVILGGLAFELIIVTWGGFWS